ncbi:MAG: RES family NAD+ phosphorylase [Verrucomicrobiales bacterium]
MALAWRIVGIGRADSAFDGAGARLFGGRWNTRGQAMIYTAGSRALAALEVLVHLERPLSHAFVRFAVKIPDACIQALDDQVTWCSLAHRPTIDPATQQRGDDWVRQASSLVLQVPSSVIPEEPNYLINPQHPEFARLIIGPPESFSLDPRLS